VGAYLLYVILAIWAGISGSVTNNPEYAAVMFFVFCFWFYISNEEVRVCYFCTVFKQFWLKIWKNLCVCVFYFFVFFEKKSKRKFSFLLHNIQTVLINFLIVLLVNIEKEQSDHTSNRQNLLLLFWYFLCILIPHTHIYVEILDKNSLLCNFSLM